MTGRDRIVLMVVVVAVFLVGGWMLLVSPKRKEAKTVEEKVTTAQRELASAESQLSNARAAQAQYSTAYAAVVNLGKAVPASQEVASLVYQLEEASNHRDVSFNSIVSGSAGPASSSSSSSSSSSATATASAGVHARCRSPSSSPGASSARTSLPPADRFHRAPGLRRPQGERAAADDPEREAGARNERRRQRGEAPEHRHGHRIRAAGRTDGDLGRDAQLADRRHAGEPAPRAPRPRRRSRGWRHERAVCPDQGRPDRQAPAATWSRSSARCSSPGSPTRCSAAAPRARRATCLRCPVVPPEQRHRGDGRDHPDGGRRDDRRLQRTGPRRRPRPVRAAARHRCLRSERRGGCSDSVRRPRKLLGELDRAAPAAKRRAAPARKRPRRANSRRNSPSRRPRRRPTTWRSSSACCRPTRLPNWPSSPNTRS